MEFMQVTVEGTHNEMGFSFGQKCKGQIHHCLDDLFRNKQADKILSSTLQFVPFFQKYLPEILEEIKGIGDGAGISEKEALYLQTRWEIPYTPDTQFKEECTSFAIGSKVTEDGEYFAGINKDVSEWSRENMIILKMIPKDSPKLLMVAYVGSAAGPGMNEYGVCFFGNSLSGESSHFGIPQPLMMRLLLSQKDVEGCIGVVQELMSENLIGFSGNFTVCDAKQNMACIEIMNGSIDVIRQERNCGFIIHTNHLLSQKPELLLKEKFQPTWNSQGRLKRFHEMIELRKGQIDFEYIRSILSDHQSYPHGICCHAKGTNLEEGAVTATSIVALPLQKGVKICKGNPCESRYNYYVL